MVELLNKTGAATVALVGKINTENAQETETEIMKLWEQTGCAHLILDAERLEYISSAGLRAIMRLAKKDRKLEIIITSLSVYEVFSMTGFTEILQIRKALRKLSVDGCEIIGQGRIGTVYRLSEEEIIKVFHPGVAMEELERELERSRKAFVRGIPTAISYDIVQVGECYGLVYELLNADTLAKSVERAPERTEEYGELFGKLLRTVHSAKVEPGELPDTKSVYTVYVERMKKYLTEEEGTVLDEMLDAMPEGTCFLHSDFHPKNVMMQNGEVLLIDMGDISIGSPLFDLASTCNVMYRLSDEAIYQSTGIPIPLRDRFWKKFTQTYFATEDEEKLAHYGKIIYAASMFRWAVGLGTADTFSDESRIERVQELRERLFPNADALIETIRAHGAEFGRIK